MDNSETRLQVNDKIDKWEKKLRAAIPYYEPVIQEIEDNYECYKGTRDIYNSKGKKSDKQKTSVRKVAFELVEAQVDSYIPQPKVTSIKGNENRAQIIEHYLQNELVRLPFAEINDEQSRTTCIAGGSLFLVEWDNSVKTRNTIGKLVVKNLQPSEIVPQPGVYKIEDMDYIFIRLLQTKQYIKDAFGVDVSEEDNNEANDPTHNEDLLTNNFVYYKNEKGQISLFSWVNDVVIQDIDNYFARKVEVCSKCGQPKAGLDECENCGSKKFELKTLDNEKVTIPAIEVDPITGNQIQVEKEIEIPYYIPKTFPIVMRKGTSEAYNLFGTSDVTVIKDQQNDLNIYSTKIREKLLKGGSIVTVPDTIKFKANNEELKIVPVKTPAEAQMITAQALQPNVSNDVNLLALNYEIARQTIGITDSYQGRKDTTAVSGKAKEFAAQQTAGRLESKKTMKDFAFAQLFKVMFQFILAYADEPRYYNYQDETGQLQYRLFDKRSFIDQDDNGKYYYDDEFIFGVDESATLSTNRRAMWEETRLNFSSGAYGNPQDVQTIVMFWQMMDSLHYPGAKQALRFASQRAEQQAQMQMQQTEIENTQNSQKLAINALGQINKANTGTSNMGA